MIRAQYTCSSTTSDAVEDTYLVYRGSEECLGTLRCVRKIEPMETFATDGDITVALHITTPKRMKSRYWKYFGFWADENGTIFDNRKVVCRLCNQIQTYHGNTTNLRNHLKIHHKMELAEIEGHSAAICWESSSESPNPNQNAIVSFQQAQPQAITCEPAQQMCGGDTPRGGNATVHEICTEQDAKSWHLKNKFANVACLLCDDLLPVRLVEGQGFQNFVQALKPGCRLPTADAVKEDIRKMYNTSYNELCEVLSKIDTLALAIESWSGKENFFTITVHYINSEWEAEHRVLQTCMYKNWQTPSSVANDIVQCIEVFQLNKKVVAVTTDGTDFLANVVEEYFNFSVIQCLACHVNQCVLQALTSSDSLQSVIAKLKAAAEYFATSPADAELLEKKQNLLNISNNELLCYNEASWKSLYDMLQRAMEQHAALASVVLERKLEHIELSSSEWSLIQQLVDLLKAANATTIALLSHEYPCASTVLPLLRLLLDSFKRVGEGELQVIKELREQMLNDFSSKFQNPDINDVLNIASFCDPRFKALPHLSDEERESVKNKVKMKMTSIAEEDKETSECETDVDGPPAKRAREDMSVMEDLFATFFEPAQRRTNKSNSPFKTLDEKSELELKNYLAEDRLPLSSDPMVYWKCAQHRFPLLAQVAKQMLCIPGTSVPSDRVFNSDKDDVTHKRLQLETDVLDCILFLHDHMHKKVHAS